MSRQVAVLFVVGLLATVAQLPAGIIFQDNFNDATYGQALTAFSSKWVVVAGNVDVIGEPVFDYYPGHGLYVDMDGSDGELTPGVNATIRTVQEFQPGYYTLSFFLGNNWAQWSPYCQQQPSGCGIDNTITVELGDYTSGVILASTATPQHIVLTFRTTTAGYLTFIGDGPTDATGAILDDIILSPEPASFALTGGALLGIFALLRRRRS